MNAQSIVSGLLENWDNWTPSAHDIAWTALLVSKIGDGGFWQTSQGTFKLDKKAHTLTWIDGERGEIFQKVSKVAPHFGWRVVLPGSPDEQSFSM